MFHIHGVTAPMPRLRVTSSAACARPKLAVFAVFAPVVGVADAGLLGAALLYTIQLGGLFQWAVKQSAEVGYVIVARAELNICSAYRWWQCTHGFLNALQKTKHGKSKRFFLF